MASATSNTETLTPQLLSRREEDLFQNCSLVRLSRTELYKLYTGDLWCVMMDFVGFAIGSGFRGFLDGSRRLRYLSLLTVFYRSGLRGFRFLGRPLVEFRLVYIGAILSMFVKEINLSMSIDPHPRKTVRRNFTKWLYLRRRKRK